MACSSGASASSSPPVAIPTSPASGTGTELPARRASSPTRTRPSWPTAPATSSSHQPIEAQVQTRDEATGETVERRVFTTVGRIIFNEVVPERLRFVNQPLDPDRPAQADRRLLPAARPDRDGPLRRRHQGRRLRVRHPRRHDHLGRRHPTRRRTSRPRLAAADEAVAGHRPRLPPRPHHQRRALRAGRRGLAEDDLGDLGRDGRRDELGDKAIDGPDRADARG